MANFIQRTTKPNRSNLEYVKVSSGGWSQCVTGNPVVYECDVLANCVGYACGRFNEIYNSITGNVGMKYPAFNCNAENFPERARSVYPELEMGSEPRPGAIIVWRKGSTASSDGAGHVEVVEEVVDSHTIKTSASSYGGRAFYTATRTYNNGNWVDWSGYYFRCFIYNPAVDGCIVEPVDRDVYSPQIEVSITNLRVRGEPSLEGEVLGFCTKGIFNYYEVVYNEEYKWFRIADGKWVALVNGVKELPYVEWNAPKTVERDESKNQLEISVTGLRIRETPSTDAHIFGTAELGYYDVFDIQGKEDYTWYKLGEGSWVAGVQGTTYLPYTVAPDINKLIEENEKLAKENEELKKSILSMQKELETLKNTNSELVSELTVSERELSKSTEKLYQALEKANELIEIFK